MAALQSALVADKEVVGKHGQCRGPVIKDNWGALSGTPVGGVGAAISKWTAHLCERRLEKSPRRRTHANTRRRNMLLRDANSAPGRHLAWPPRSCRIDDYETHGGRALGVNTGGN